VTSRQLRDSSSGALTNVALRWKTPTSPDRFAGQCRVTSLGILIENDCARSASSSGVQPKLISAPS